MKPSKKEFKAIAMKCDQEQFNRIKPKLENAGEIGNLLYAFERYNYLTNNYDSSKMTFDFIEPEGWENEHKNNIHETWNEEIFLNSCGIETEPSYAITKEQLKEINEFCLMYSKASSDKLKEWFPEVFEVKLVVGKWYKNLDKNKMIVFVIDFIDNQKIRGYGFDTHGNWEGDDARKSWGLPSDGNFREATHEEVFEALKSEAVRRYENEFVIDNSNICSLGGIYKLSKNKVYKCWENNMFSVDEVCVFNKGQWASIIPTITKEEAEKLLNKKIV